MAIPFVVVDGELSRPIRLRKAILGKFTDEKTVPYVTPQDVQRVWATIGSSGYCPRSISKIANSDDVDPKVFTLLMKSLNSYL